MRKFGLIGYPLGHSFSKKYFTEKFQDEHITDCSYENYPLKNIEEFSSLLTSETDLCGLNVTIPYKTEVIKYLNSISPEASEIGAVNVIRITRRGGIPGLSGYNSDVTGFTDSLLPYLKKRSGNALVLGSGGSSKAVCFALGKIGMNVTLVSRNSKPGTIAYSGIDENLISKTDLIVNSTPLGMFPNVESKPELNYDLLNERHILYDLVYNPELTAFLKEGKERGCVTINGYMMLRLQAEKSWEIWNQE
jgi:shikimate dehydrogenase